MLILNIYMLILKFQYYNIHHLLIFILCIYVMLLQCTWIFGNWWQQCPKYGKALHRRMWGFNNPMCPAMRPHSQEGPNPGNNSVSSVVCVMEQQDHISTQCTIYQHQINTLNLFQKESRHEASLRTPLHTSNPQCRYFCGKYQLPVTFYSCFLLPKSLLTILFLLLYKRIQPSKWSKILFR